MASNAAMERLEDRLDASNARQREGKGLLSEISGAGLGGALLGFLESKNPSVESGFGPGERIKGLHVVAVGGLIMGKKKNKTGRMARAAGLGALFCLARDMAKNAGI